MIVAGNCQVKRVFIGLGSNLGDGKAILAAAWRKLCEGERIRAVALSHPYVTAPVGMVMEFWS